MIDEAKPEAKEKTQLITRSLNDPKLGEYWRAVNYVKNWMPIPPSDGHLLYSDTDSVTGALFRSFTGKRTPAGSVF